MGFELANTLVERVDFFTEAVHGPGDRVDFFVDGPHGAVHVCRLDGGGWRIHRLAEFNLIHGVPNFFGHPAFFAQLTPFREFEFGHQRDFELLPTREGGFGDGGLLVDDGPCRHFHVFTWRDDDERAARDDDVATGRE